MKKIAFIAAIGICMASFAGCGKMDKMIDAAKEAAESVISENLSDDKENSEEENTTEAESIEEKTTEAATEKSVEETSEEKEESKEESEKETSESQTSDKVIYESENVRIEFIGEEQTESYFEINLSIENLTDSNAVVYIERGSVCDVMVDSFMYAEIEAGQTSEETISFYSRDLEMNNIDQIGTVEFKAIVSDAESYETIEKTDMLSIKLDEVSSYKRNEGKVIFNDKGFKLTYIGVKSVEDTLLGSNIVFELENSSDRNITVSMDGVKVDGNECDAFHFNEITAGKYTNTDFSFFDEIDFAAAKKVEFTFRVIDSDSYDSIIEEYPVTIELK